MGEATERPRMTTRRVRRGGATVPLPDLLAWGRGELARSGIPQQEATWLLEWVLGENSLLFAPQEVGRRAVEGYRSAIAQRKSRIPLQHITGTMSFRSLELSAGPGVFSTRPETESLVDIALELAGPRPRIVDLCSGSGAVGLALATELSATSLWLVENSPEALRYLQTNVSRYFTDDPDVVIEPHSALSALPDLDGTVDLVVCNPPYVGLADAPTQPEAQADPAVALYGGGEDGLVLPRGIVQRSHGLLRPGGFLVMEHGATQGPALQEHALTTGFTGAWTREDFTGTPRFLMAQKPRGDRDG